MSESRSVDVVVVGCGFAGLAMATHLKRSGFGSFLILERADDIGGTWRDNTYPGAQVDVPSPLYSLSFDAAPQWSRLNAHQAEIWEHQKRVFRTEGLAPHLRASTELVSATWNSVASRWDLHTTRGAIACRVLVTATGHLSEPKLPPIPGIATFQGDLMHSARWRHDCSIDGKRVAVIGSGASAVQVIPAIVNRVDHLTVLQRSAAWCLPRNDREFSRAERRMHQRLPESLRDLREELYWSGEASVPQRHGIRGQLDRLRSAALQHLHTQVTDDELRARLLPDYEIGCKRVLRSDDYYPAMGLPNVTLDTAAISSITGRCIVTENAAHEVDVIICCTGFEVAQPPIAERLAGRDGELLSTRWRSGSRAYATTAVHGYPNYFVMNGPNSGLGAGTSVIDIVEIQASYIRQAIDFMHDNDVSWIEVTADAEQRYVEDVERRASGTVWLDGGCTSWYVDARSGKLTTLWPDFVSQFFRENGVFDPSAYICASAES